MKALVTALVATVLVGAGAIAAAPAQAETSAQVRSLARSAEQDPAALARLRRITVVDGRQLNLGSLLNTSGATLTERLRTLASGPVASAPPDAAARARRILSERRFTGSSVPRPLHGVLAWLGRKFSFVGRFESWLAGIVPGGNAVVWPALCLLVLAAAAVVATRLAGRREGRLQSSERRERRRHLDDPAALERDAATAEERGELELALRLRFRAGLIRLGRADRLPLRDSLTSGEAARLLRLADFDALARSFDEVVYGRRQPAETDVVQARAAWERVLTGTGGA